jgi:superfamily II DNA or RNA helicase
MSNSHYFAKYSSSVIQRVFQADTKTKLYPHQQGALLTLLEMASKGELNPEIRSSDCGAAFFLVGVGCGKTVILQAAPYVIGQYMKGKQVIFLSDNTTLRRRVMDDFPSNAKGEPYKNKWELYKLGIISENTPPPQIIELEPKTFWNYKIDTDKGDILVANRQFLINLVKQGVINPENVGLIVVDEAHHSAARTYREIFSYFNSAILMFLTGTRHRGDGDNLPFVKYILEEHEEENGTTVLRKAPKPDFEFTIQDAWKLNPPIIKNIAYQPAKSDGFKVEEEGQEIEYDVNQFYDRAERNRKWFHECILADSFCKPVLDEAVRLLAIKRGEVKQGALSHQMIIRALNIKHANRLKELCEAYPLLTGKVGLVHSENDEFDREGEPSEIFKKFSAGEYIALIHVAMVGEGFNVPYSSISVPLCIMRSTQKAEQEFGRIIRKVAGSFPVNKTDLEADNMGIIVTHDALGIEDLYNHFVQGDPYKIVEEEEEVGESQGRLLADDYKAGDSTLQLTSTNGLSSEDELIVKVFDNKGQEKSITFFVEEILEDGVISVTPLMVDIEQGSPARKAPRVEEISTDFIGHVGLKWYIKTSDGSEISIEEYQRRKALEKNNLLTDTNGEIVTPQGQKITELSPAFQEMILKGLRQSEEEVEIPTQSLVPESCRPDIARKNLQSSYKKRVTRAIYDVCRYTLESASGKDLVNNPLKCLIGFDKQSNKTNDQYLISAIFSFVKKTTEKKWSEHNDENEFIEAHDIALEKIEEVRQELINRRQQYKKV